MYRAVWKPSYKKLCSCQLFWHAACSSRQIARASFSPGLQNRRTSPPHRTLRPKSSAQFTRKKTIDELVVPVRFNFKAEDSSEISLDSKLKKSSSVSEPNIGNELTGGVSLTKSQLASCLNLFLKRVEIRQLCEQHGLGPKLFNLAFLSFRNYCLERQPLPTELHLLFHDLQHNQGHVDDLLPYFMEHAKKVYPHLECLDDLKKISDLRLPHNWYLEARAIQRKIFFHAGPTNSGKTYQALKKFMGAKSAIYCGPLKMLASEVFYKTNDANVPCDLITGEERRFASIERPMTGASDSTAENDIIIDTSATADDDSSATTPSAAAHISCTVEMLNTSTPYDVAVIDEIQMLRDQQRGWAWTRALLGVNAREVHLCGEYAALRLVQELLFPVNEEVEVFKYKRMTPLKVCSQHLETFNNIRSGDCVVAFNKSDVYKISRAIKETGREVAVIYGSLPPATKLAQAQRFNDPENACKVLVATDAIGMGLNLSIKRVIFWALAKPVTTKSGEREVETLPTSAALQIAGRAGRYGTVHEMGEVTTFKRNDLKTLQQILTTKVDDIEKAGLYPTIEQMEMFSFFLPKATLSNLMDIFVSLCSVDESRYFMCNVEDFKYLAALIEHVPNLSLKVRYMFCLAPASPRQLLTCQQFVKFARKYSTGEPLTWAWLAANIQWEKMVKKPERIVDLIHLETLFDVMDLYLWLAYRFADGFRDEKIIREKQRELDRIIEDGVSQIASLLSVASVNDDATTSDNLPDTPPSAPAAPCVDDVLHFIRKSHGSQSVSRDLSADAGDESQNLKPPLTFPSLTAKLTSMKKLGRAQSVDDKPNPLLDATPFTRRLLRRGLLTPTMVERLRGEWAAEMVKLSGRTGRDGRKKH